MSAQFLGVLKEGGCRNLWDFDVAVLGDLVLDVGIHVWANRADLAE